MRLSAIADRLATLEGREADEIHIKLRNPLMKALLSGEAGRGRNSPSDYATEELIRARLLLTLVDCGLTTAELEQVNRKLNAAPASGLPHPESAKTAGGWHFLIGLHSIIRGTKAGETWLIRVRFTRTAEGLRRVSPWVRWEGWQDDPKPGILVDLLEGETHLGTLNCPASDLIRPLLGDLEG